MTQPPVIEGSQLLELIGRVARATRLMAPARRGRNSFGFTWIEHPGEAHLEYVRTVLPPKQAILPPREQLLDFRRRPDPAGRAAIAHEPFVLFGVHPCDLAAINQLDWAMEERHGVKDPHHAARRAAATIVGVECLPDEYCFCTSVGTADTRKGADLFLTPIRAGYLVETLTPRGKALLARGDGMRDASADEVAQWESWHAEKVRLTTCRLEAEPAEFPDLLEARYDSEIWEQTADRCYSCGTCTNVCPTCFCFDVDDQVEVQETDGTRFRRYDSCQFLDFALVAGGHNFRKERPDRVRHRWFRKFVYLNREHGQPFCVGCGRCTQACTAGISLTSVLNSVVTEARGGAAK